MLQLLPPPFPHHTRVSLLQRLQCDKVSKWKPNTTITHKLLVMQLRKVVNFYFQCSTPFLRKNFPNFIFSFSNIFSMHLKGTAALYPYLIAAQPYYIFVIIVVVKQILSFDTFTDVCQCISCNVHQNVVSLMFLPF